MSFSRAETTMPVPILRRVTALVLILVLITPLPGASQDDESIGDIRRDRESARDAEAAALEELELLELEDVRIGEIVAEIQATVDAQVARVVRARRELDASEAEVLQRARLAREAAEDLVATEEAMRRRAVEVFVETGAEGQPWLNSNDLNRTAIRLALIDLTAGNDRDLLDQLRALRADLDAHVRAGEDARVEADALRRVLEDELLELQARRLVQTQIQDELRGRINEWLREADQRAQEAQELTDLIRLRQSEELGFAPGDPGSASVEGFLMPSGGSIGSKFGPRLHPIFRTTRKHAGVDISGSTGDPVWASKEGRVIFAGSKGGYGNAVIIQHEGNVATLYAHLSGFRTTEGEWVDAGEVIGLIGSTGWSTGPHLHFEVRIDGVPKDPELVLPI